MKREAIDFTDRELSVMCEAIKSYICDRNTWLSRGKARVVNSVIKKVCDNGMKRKNPKRIIYPIFDFDYEG